MRPENSLGKHLREQRLHRVRSQPPDTGAIDDPVECLEADPAFAARPQAGADAVMNRRDADQSRRADRQPPLGLQCLDPFAHGRREPAAVDQPGRFGMTDEAPALFEAETFPQPCDRGRSPSITARQSRPARASALPASTMLWKRPRSDGPFSGTENGSV